ncbi:MAG: TetR/AcrR family transcriptional regulator [Pseudonocardiales bacterium]
MPLPEGAENVAVSSAQSGRERVLGAAYNLFSCQGTRAVGVDAVIGEAGVAKMTLYRNFASKNDLILAFLERRENLWTHGWVQAESWRRGLVS